MALNETEAHQLAALLGRVEWPLPNVVFHALMRCAVSVPIELAIIDHGGRVLLLDRCDQEYDGYHLPGTVLRDSEHVPDALNRLIAGELHGMRISRPESIGWVETPRGDGPGANPTRHEISLIFLARFVGVYDGRGVFFPMDALPERILPHHIKLIARVREHYDAS